MASATYQVYGMTCEHCVRAVSAELTDLAGVSGVSVDLACDVVGADNPFMAVDLVTCAGPERSCWAFG